MVEQNIDIPPSARARIAPRDNRHALRDATRDVHNSAEGQWTHSLGATGGGQALLLAMSMLHANFGQPAAQHAGGAAAVDLEASRLRALKQDGAQADVARKVTARPELSNRDYSWGVLYALNGSAMGASMMLQPGGIMAHEQSAYMTLMQNYARSGGLGAFFRLLNAQDLAIDTASKGASAVFTAMTEFALTERA